jgi:hypothetical protein
MTRTPGSKYVLLLGLSCLAVTASATAAPREKPSECVRAWFDARYGNAGYDHVVHLASKCGAPVTCEVSSDVAPQSVRVQVPAGASAEVVILRGSPARQFTPHAECRFPEPVAPGND